MPGYKKSNYKRKSIKKKAQKPRMSRQVMMREYDGDAKVKLVVEKVLQHNTASNNAHISI